MLALVLDTCADLDAYQMQISSERTYQTDHLDRRLVRVSGRSPNDPSTSIIFSHTHRDDVFLSKPLRSLLSANKLCREGVSDCTGFVVLECSSQPPVQSTTLLLMP